MWKWHANRYTYCSITANHYTEVCLQMRLLKQIRKALTEHYRQCTCTVHMHGTCPVRVCLSFGKNTVMPKQKSSGTKECAISNECIRTIRSWVPSYRYFGCLARKPCFAQGMMKHQTSSSRLSTNTISNEQPQIQCDIIILKHHYWVFYTINDTQMTH